MPCCLPLTTAESVAATGDSLMLILTSGHSDTEPLASECPDVKNYKWRSLWHRMLYSCGNSERQRVKAFITSAVTSSRSQLSLTSFITSSSGLPSSGWVSVTTDWLYDKFMLLITFTSMDGRTVHCLAERQFAISAVQMSLRYCKLRRGRTDVSCQALTHLAVTVQR